MAKRTPRTTRAAKVAATDPANIPNSFDSPESSNILRAQYDRGQRILKVTFKRGAQSTYLAGGVPLDLWRDFACAASKGGFFALHLKTQFHFTPEVGL